MVIKNHISGTNISHQVSNNPNGNGSGQGVVTMNFTNANPPGN